MHNPCQSEMSPDFLSFPLQEDAAKAKDPTKWKKGRQLHNAAFFEGSKESVSCMAAAEGQAMCGKKEELPWTGRLEEEKNGSWACEGGESFIGNKRISRIKRDLEQRTCPLVFNVFYLLTWSFSSFIGPGGLLPTESWGPVVVVVLLTCQEGGRGQATLYFPAKWGEIQGFSFF